MYKRHSRLYQGFPNHRRKFNTNTNTNIYFLTIHLRINVFILPKAL